MRAAIFVAVSTGYWRGMPLHYQWLSLFLWRFYLPLTSRLYGYAPARKIRWGENLPAGVAREWGAWCLEPTYLAAYFDDGGHRESLDGAPFGPIYFDQVQCPIRAYYFTDDPIATRANVQPMMRLFTQAAVETSWVSPDSLGLREIGHLGFFRSKVGPALWDEALDWLREQAQ